MHFSDLDRVIGKEVVPLELQVAAVSVESQNFSIVVQELFLGGNVTTSELLLQELQELWILLWRDWLLGDNEAVFGADLCLRLWLLDVLEEIPSVLVRIIDTDRSAADSDVEADSEVGWLERHVGAIRLQDHLSIEEGSLHRAAVHHFGLDHQN